MRSRLHWAPHQTRAGEGLNSEVRKTGGGQCEGAEETRRKIRASETLESAQAATLPLDILRVAGSLPVDLATSLRAVTL